MTKKKEYFDEDDVNYYKNAEKKPKNTVTPTDVAIIIGLVLIVCFGFWLMTSPSDSTQVDTIVTATPTVTITTNTATLYTLCPIQENQPVQVLTITNARDIGFDNIGRVGYRWVGHGIDEHMWFGVGVEFCTWPKPTSTDTFYVAIEVGSTIQYIAADAQAPYVSVNLLPIGQ